MIDIIIMLGILFLISSCVAVVLILFDTFTFQPGLSFRGKVCHLIEHDRIYYANEKEGIYYVKCVRCNTGNYLSKEEFRLRDSSGKSKVIWENNLKEREETA